MYKNFHRSEFCDKLYSKIDMVDTGKSCMLTFRKFFNHFPPHSCRHQTKDVGSTQISVFQNVMERFTIWIDLILMPLESTIDKLIICKCGSIKVTSRL